MNSFKKIIIIFMILLSSLAQGKKNKYKNNYIYIKNNVLLIKINKFNGNINKIKLLKYKDTKSIKNLNSKIDTNIYKINLNKYNKKNIFFKNIYIYKNKDYIKIIWNTKDNNTIYNKYFILNKNSYKWYLNFKIKNNSQKNISYKIYNKIINKNNNITNNVSYLDENNKFEKNNIHNIKNIKSFPHKIIWTTISEKYFSTILIPIKNNYINNFNIQKKNNDTIVKYINIIKIKPKENKTIKFKLWTGPNLTKNFNNLSKNLDLNIDYGKLWFISKPILKILIYINKFVNNWGICIIIITIISKILMYPINKWQSEILNKINYIYPKIEKIKIKYKNKKNKINQKIINLYKKYNVNPITGFMLILIQIPLFISIYNVISQTTEFKNSKFIFWIQDLSSYDQYYILPLIMGLSMLLLQKKNNDNKNIFLTPLIFVILSLYFPSGVILYYTINNLITFIQQNIYN